MEFNIASGTGFQAFGNTWVKHNLLLTMLLFGGIMIIAMQSYGGIRIQMVFVDDRIRIINPSVF